MKQSENRDSAAVVPATAIINAWPKIRPHVREAIVTLIDAALIQSRLQQSAILESSDEREIAFCDEVCQP